MEYNFREIEQKWQKRWVENGTYRVVEDEKRKKFYVLNMFPYPSGAGLHVGHPLGYIASDIYARYKRQQGYNVLNPMGYDAYGLPAEQYAIQTGQHPAITTEQNIRRYREQLDKIGFSFDWEREVRTCDPIYYKWTQWAFQRMFKSYYSLSSHKAQPTIKLIEHFELMGTENCNALGTEELHFTASDWASFSEKKKQEVLMNYRIAYLADTMVNWCPKLGTVLANDEVVDGVSVRGGYPVVQKKMRQWCLRVSAYAQRLLDGLDTIDWTDSLKETQRNWIGRSEGTEVEFKVATPPLPPEGGISAEAPLSPSGDDRGVASFTIFTTRADTMFGVTFMVLAPESDLVAQLTTPDQKEEVEKYLDYVKKRTERDRQMDHKVTGVFSGSYAINPFTEEKIPIWIAEYVLAGYGTGAIMAVPAHDSRDYAFAKHFGLPIIPLIEGADVSEQSYDAKEGIVINSPVGGAKSAAYGKQDAATTPANAAPTPTDAAPTPTDAAPVPANAAPTPADSSAGPKFSLNGLTVKEAIAATKKYVTEQGLGRVKVNYRLRDAIFSRQRYWGEPFPVYYKDDMPYMIPKECLPLELPEIDEYKPTETGEPPLGRAKRWAWDTKTDTVVDCSAIDHKTVFPLELNTMPGFAGSSAYYLRYMDPKNEKALVSHDADEYWRSVDLYVGGTEHATGHLIYSRFWNKFLYDSGYSCEDEPFKKLINQGMIQGRSNFVYRVEDEGADKGKFVSAGLKDKYTTTPIHVDVNIVSADVLDLDAFRAWRPEYENAEFILEDGKYICGWAVEKMSKSMFNVVNPDMIVEKYGADTLRLYEMFLGPVEQSKPWDTNGIDGCHRFLKKFWALFYGNSRENPEGRLLVTPAAASTATAAANDAPAAGSAATAAANDAPAVGYAATESQPTPAELKSVHKLIKKVSQDIEAFSYNTAISAFMICVGELSQLKCKNREMLKTLVILIAPFAPHIAEELWEALGEQGSVCDSKWPTWNEDYLVENTVKLGIAFNGKTRFDMEFAADADNQTIQDTVLADERSKKYIEGDITKVIIVPKRMVNIVFKK